MNFIFLSLCIASCALPIHSSICDECNGTVTQPSEVKEYCNHHHFQISHRCCINGTADNFTQSDIVGIDLRNCSLENENVTGLLTNLTSVAIISLEDNPLSKVTEHDFYGLTQLEYLSLPPKIKSCPGGQDAWNESSHTEELLLCKFQIDSCGTKENNETCPSPQSYCAPAGPGLVDCLCSPDYHGYKCLRKGTFPMVPFVSGICGSTFVVASFLWVTQRRFVKKHTA